MEKGLLHLHVTVVTLFTLLYALKVYYLLSNNTGLDNLRSKTKIADMILGTLILATGIYLTVISPVINTYLIVKIVLVLASIPVGIIAMKKSIKPMAITALLMYVYVFAVAKTNSLTFTKEQYVAPVTTTAVSAVEEGKTIYNSQCALCHGSDGKLMLNGAKDLSVSELSHEETIRRIKKGKGLMPGFEDQLNEKQIQAVAAYAETLQKK